MSIWGHTWYIVERFRFPIGIYTNNLKITYICVCIKCQETSKFLCFLLRNICILILPYTYWMNNLVFYKYKKNKPLIKALQDLLPVGHNFKPNVGSLDSCFCKIRVVSSNCKVSIEDLFFFSSFMNCGRRAEFSSPTIFYQKTSRQTFAYLNCIGQNIENLCQGNGRIFLHEWNTKSNSS